MSKEYRLIANSFGNASGDTINFMDKSNSRQIFEYILSNTIEDKIDSYLNVFSGLKHCTLPISANLLLNYYAVQSLEHNLLSVRDDMLVFLQIEGIPNNYEKIFSGTLKYIKRVYQKVIDQNNKKRVEYTLNKSISVDSYTKEIFLEPENVLKYLNKYKQYKINDLTDYKDIINSILFDNGTYKLSESDKSYYLKIFSELLEEKSITMLLNNANINTMRQVAQHVYQTDLNYVDNIHCNIPENYQNTYKNIVQILKE